MCLNQNEKDNFKPPVEITYHPVCKNSLPFLEYLSHPYVTQMTCEKMLILFKINHNKPCCH